MNTNNTLPLEQCEADAEQAAQALYKRLKTFRQLHAEDQLNSKQVGNYRTRLIEGMEALGFVEVFHHVEAFMRDAGLETCDHNPEQGLSVWKLIERKYREFEDAVWHEQPEAELNAGIDLVWVTIALLISHGHNPRGAFIEIARANADKIARGGAQFTGDGRVAKPRGWKPPRLNEHVGY